MLCYAAKWRFRILITSTVLVMESSEGADKSWEQRAADQITFTV